jgi:protein-S-isoprenylcysteine O-methyltransferase Ste14
MKQGGNDDPHARPITGPTTPAAVRPVTNPVADPGRPQRRVHRGGTGAGRRLAAWRLLTHGHGIPAPAAWEAVPVIAAGAALYFWCAWNFATVGGGTPGPWDAPRRVVAHGPYRWVRNPIYLGALLVVLGEAWLFTSPRLLAYAAAMAACFHLFVTGYEERTLARRFGPAYLEYRRAVPRWLPRKPDAPQPAR